MVRLLLCLSLLLTWSNANAWYCSYTPTSEGYISNLQCHDIDPTIAVQNYWCPYRNSDPICRQFDQPVIPACTDRTEVQSLSCQPHYSGVINQSRTYYCQSNSYSDWVTTSNNCTPDPPTCHTSIESRQVACQEGYTGQITETRSSTCPDPYGQPTFGAWVETSNSCVKSITNVTNVASPVSPISPVSVSPVVEVQPIVETPVQVQQTPTTETPTTQSQTATETPKTTQENSSNTPKTNTVTPQSNNTPAPISSPKQSENNSSVSVPKGRDLVPGFGIVMSLELLNAPITFQQQQLEIALDYSQELPDGIRGNQEFLTELITQGSASGIFDISSKRWRDLYRNYEVQPGY